MRSLSSKLILGCLTLTLLGSLQAQGGSYPSWKHELQDHLGLEQTGKADRTTFDALVVYLTELDLMDETLEKGEAVFQMMNRLAEEQPKTVSDDHEVEPRGGNE